MTGRIIPEEEIRGGREWSATQGNRIIVSVILSEAEESRETLNNVIPVKTGISTRSWRSASGGRLRGNDGLNRLSDP